VSEPKPSLPSSEHRTGAEWRWTPWVVAFVLGCGIGAFAQLGTRLAERLAESRATGGPSWAGIGGWVLLGAGLASAWFLGRATFRLAQSGRQGQRMAVRLDSVAPPEDPARGPRGLDRQLDRVISGYRASHALAARVAELEGQLANLPPVEPGPPAPAPAPPAQPRARQLSESSFVTGSDALVRVRTAIRLVQDCRQRLDGGPAGPAGVSGSAVDQGENGGPVPAREPTPEASVLMGDLFRALGAEIGDLTRSAQGLGGAVEGLIQSAETAQPSETSPASQAGAIDPDDPSRVESEERAFSALKCRSLAVELEGGLQRLGAELRLLSFSAWRRSSDASDRPERNGSDRSVTTGLRRLEGQLEEVADHLSRLTRDAEELSRELGR
jgi:hypothetical protein